MKYRVREVEAMQYTGDTKALLEYLGQRYGLVAADDVSCIVASTHIQHAIRVGGYVQKLDNGRIKYHTAPDFEGLYEPVPPTEA